MSEIRRMLELGNSYAANRQWGNAASMLTEVLDRLYSDDAGWQSMESLGALPEALRNLAEPNNHPEEGEHEMEWPTISIDADGADVFRQLRDKLGTSHPHPRDLQDASFVSAFHHASSDHWTIVYHRQRDTKHYGDLAIRLPAAPSVSFVLKLDGDTVKHKPTTPRMAYAWAHLAQATVISTMALYDEHQILIETGVPAILARAKYYQWALLIEPNNPWALAHFGEMYRDIANGWPGFTIGHGRPHHRLNDYIWALAYFDTAVQLYGDSNPSSSWVQAHLAATIINTRCFVGSSKTDPTTLEMLLKDWFKGSDVKDLKSRLLERALLLFVRAQELQGFYYPWAQYYYGVALALKPVLKGSHGPEVNTATLGAVQIPSAIYLAPDMIREVFEPGQLLVNPSFEMAIVRYCKGDYATAWQYAWIGMRYLFKFYYLPGLEGFIGCWLLVNIARGWMGLDHEARRRSDTDGLLKESMFHAVGNATLQIPQRPFDTSSDLCAFIEKAYTTFGGPAVEPFLQPPIDIDTKVAVGLVQALFILDGLLMTISDLTYDDQESQTRAESTRQTLQGCVDRIRMKGFELVPDEDSRKHIGDTMFTSLETGKANFHSALRLRVISTRGI